MKPQEEKEDLSIKRERNLGKCSLPSQMVFDSKTDGSKPGRALAFSMSPLEKGASFYLLKILWLPELKER